jgi:TolB-like protein
MTTQPDIFLSYNREDQARAKVFAEAFAAQGFSVWWDVGLKTGEAYDEVTENALRTAKAVVVLWSKKSVVSRWVRAEATLADRNKTLVPCMIEPCERPIMFELTQTAELAHWQGDTGDSAWTAFLGDVKQFVRGDRTPLAPDLMAIAPAAAVDRQNIQGKRGEVPSLAILPFTNRSKVVDDDVYAEGMVADIVAALSQGASLRVLASTATAHLIGGAITDLAKVGRQLGVRYLLEGNVRRAGADFRVTTQLIEAASGHVLWSGKFGRPLSELSDLQEELASEVAAALDSKVMMLELERAVRKPGDITAWEAIHRSTLALRHIDPESLERSVEQARRATLIDPDFGGAHAMLAYASSVHYMFMVPDSAEAVAEIRAIAARAQALDPETSGTLASVAGAYNFTGAPELGHVHALKAVAAAPNSGNAHYPLAIANSMLNRFDEAIRECEIAASLMPGAFTVYYVKAWHANALIRAGRWAEGEAVYDQCLALAPDFAIGQYHKAMFCWRDGREAQGIRIVDTLRAGGMDFGLVHRVFVRAFANSPTFDDMMAAVEAVWTRSEASR